MIQQPVIPRVPLALAASGGLAVDPVTGVVTLNFAGLTPAAASSLLTAATAALPTADPHIAGAWWNNGGIPSISQG